MILARFMGGFYVQLAVTRSCNNAISRFAAQLTASLSETENAKQRPFRCLMHYEDASVQTYASIIEDILPVHCSSLSSSAKRTPTTNKWKQNGRLLINRKEGSIPPPSALEGGINAFAFSLDGTNIWYFSKFYSLVIDLNVCVRNQTPFIFLDK